MAKKRGYKFTNRTHSQKSIMSTVFGILSGVSMIVLIYLSYMQGGDVPVNYGIAGVLVLFFAVIGLILSVLALQERDKYKFFTWLGMGLNIVVLACVSAVLYAGSYL